METKLLVGVVLLSGLAAACFANGTNSVDPETAGGSTDDAGGGVGEPDPGTPPTDPGSGGTDAGASANKKDSGAANPAAGPWCQVQQFVQSNCTSCHTAGGQSPPMDTYAEMKGASQTPGQTVAQRAKARVSANSMPPGGGFASQASIFQTWISAGYPQDNCTATPPPPPPADAGPAAPAPGAINWSSPATCSFGSAYSGSQSMNPGKNCVSCHAGQLTAGGTVYQTAHEPNLCIGVQGVNVVFTDATGATSTVQTDDIGNFILSDTLTEPIHVRLEYNGKVRAMTAALPSDPAGNGIGCNSCHTQTGKNGIQGRIVVPN